MFVPQRIWWKPLHRYERSWVLVAFVWCVLLTVMMPLWFYLGRQNVPATTLRTTPAEFKAAVDAFVAEYQIGEDQFVPVVAPPPNSDVYLLAKQWQWYPVLQLEKGETYRLHLSSVDVQHGFSLQPVNLNLHVLPGYDYVATISPTTSGDFQIVCNEYCGLPHHIMTGKIIVTD